jgi:hypothetical protein
MRAVVFTDYETFPKLEEVDRPILDQGRSCSRSPARAPATPM